jgi:hypothetical protein
MANWVRRAAVALLVAEIAVVATSAPVTAALCAKWELPPSALPSQTVWIAFRTYVPFMAPTSTGYRLRPYAVPNYPFRVRAIAPDGKALPIRMRPTADATRWRGAMTPGLPGRWTLRIVNFNGADSACYSDVVLTVRGEKAQPSGSHWLALTVIVGAVALGAGVLATLRRRRRSRQS